MEWRGQVAVVTGGARGLGRATARLLAQRGAAVLVLALALIVLAATKWAAPPECCERYGCADPHRRDLPGSKHLNLF